MKTNDIKLNPDNPRNITDEALEKLKESISRDPEFMELRPIIIDKNNMVLGGNQRLKAIRALGYKEIPVNWVKKADTLTEEQYNRFILVDNAPEGMQGEWDYGKLIEDSVWNYNKPHKSDLHPTMKPVELIVNAILNSTKRNMIVSDYFLGSGSTLIACEKTNRFCYGIEKDPNYCDVIIKRWQDYTGKQAINLKTGEIFGKKQ